MCSMAALGATCLRLRSNEFPVIDLVDSHSGGRKKRIAQKGSDRGLCGRAIGRIALGRSDSQSAHQGGLADSDCSDLYRCWHRNCALGDGRFFAAIMASSLQIANAAINIARTMLSPTPPVFA